MLFSKRLPIQQKVKQKNRTFKKFKIYKNNKNFYKLRSLNFNRLFINHLKKIDAFLRKLTSKFRRFSRKEYYKKLREKNNRKKYKVKLKKRLLRVSSTQRLFKTKWYVNKIKKIRMRRYRRYHNSYMCFNHSKIPFTRKSLKSRMGKGKGGIKNWYLKFNSGKTIFYLKRWNSNYVIYALNFAKHYIPGKTIIVLPSLKKIFSNNTSAMYNI